MWRQLISADNERYKSGQGQSWRQSWQPAWCHKHRLCIWRIRQL